MDVSRRSVLKLGTLGAVGAAAVGLPLGQTVRAKSASALASSRMPKPYGTAFVRPPVLPPYNTSVDADGAPVNHYTVPERPGTAKIAPGSRPRSTATTASSRAR